MSTNSSFAQFHAPEERHFMSAENMALLWSFPVICHGGAPESKSIGRAEFGWKKIGSAGAGFTFALFYEGDRQEMRSGLATQNKPIAFAGPIKNELAKHAPDR
jgi:hypothetical protein